MISYIRKSRWAKVVSLTLAFSFVSEVIFPTVALALTGGPSQPEVESFAPIEATDMVDLFSGDFKYNIPLLDVDGYPINLNYNSNITMDQEASWVGLGWNLNPGVINRSMRGLPDEFCGDLVTKEFNLKEDITVGVSGCFRKEFFSKDDPNREGSSTNTSVGITLSYSTKTGFEIAENFGISRSLGKKTSSRFTFGLGLNRSTMNSSTLNPNLNYSYGWQMDKNIRENTNIFSLDAGVSINSIGGLKGLQLGYSLKAERIGNDNRRIKGGSLISFSTPSYTPNISFPISNKSVDLGVSFGITKTIKDKFLSLSAFFNRQYIKENVITMPAFGYMNAYDKNIDNNSLLDYNREKEVPFYETVPLMPITSRTYDIYNASAQGAGGVFRAYENQTGIVFERENTNNGFSGDLKIELGTGSIFKAGVDLTGIKSDSKTGPWSEVNPFYNNYKAQRNTKLNDLRLYQPQVFKFCGETNAESDNHYITSTGGTDNAIQFAIYRSGDSYYIKDQYVSSTENASTRCRASRLKRTQFIRSLNAIDASTYGIDKEIKIFEPTHEICFEKPENKSSEYQYTTRERYMYPSHHTSEISVTQTNGSQYVYGIPAYVNKQIEASFSVNETDANEQQGTVRYSSGDDSKDNTEGKENFCNITTLPAYAHSYLLTSVLSPEYIDLTGNGPTDDDFGNYTRFNYRNISYENNTSYKWRTPSESVDKIASYNPGYRYSKSDGKGSYIYGEKEIWYLHSIETKNYIVEFELADRHDGYGVKGKDGGFNFTDPTTKQTKRLKEIRLYSKKERLSKNTQAVPIKTVHFEYDYSLCGNVPNNDGASETVNSVDINANKGKLTLKRIYFTYGKSNKGKLNAYEFDYSNADYVAQYNQNHDPDVENVYNPSYNFKGVNRWGYYAPSSSNPLNIDPNSYGYCNLGLIANPPDGYSSYMYPYVDQRALSSQYKNDNAIIDSHNYYEDVYSSAWALTGIKLPSGSKINIKYESDDYAYIQDKRASQMVAILGFGASPTSDIGCNTYNSGNHNNYIFLKLPQAVSSNKEFYDKYIDGLKELFFKVRLKLGNSNGNGISQLFGESLFEDISGYAKIAGSTEGTDYGVRGDGTTAYIHIDDFTMEGKNPVAVAAWRFCMENESNIISGKPPLTEKPNVALSFLEALDPVSLINDLIDTFRSPWAQAEGRDVGRLTYPFYSWARLYNPNYAKKGGGSRVKKIEIQDSFDGQDKTYGQEYEYTITEKINDVNTLISSGVAAYEPQAGGDENTFHRPVYFMTTGGFAKPDNYTYIEEPVGESYFPAASVGYRKITVIPLKNNNINKHVVGNTVYEFYTAKDYPTICNRNLINVGRTSSNWDQQVFATRTFRKAVVSQGYIVKTNDMHGKPKAVLNYSGLDPNKQISGEQYFYYSKEKVLDNNVPVLTKEAPSNDNHTMLLATDYDITNDLTYSNTEVLNAGAELNLSFFITGSFPLLLPPIWPKYRRTEVEFKSAITTKHVHQYGIIKEVIKFDQSSNVKTTNLKFDPETGEVLLTKTENLHNDNTYNLMIPAHWVNSGMAASYLNTDAIINTEGLMQWNNVDNGNTQNGSIEFNDASFKPSNYFAKGDAVEITATKLNSTRNIYTGWVLDITDPGQSNGKISVVDFSGSRLLDGSYTINSIRVIKSGHKNNQSLPVMSATTKENPVPYLSTNTLASAKVLNSEAIEYDNTRKIDFNTSSKCIRVVSPEMKEALLLLNKMIYKGLYLNDAIYNGIDHHEVYVNKINLNTSSSGLFTENLKSAFKNSSDEYYLRGRFFREYNSGVYSYAFTFGISNESSDCQNGPFNLFTLQTEHPNTYFEYSDVLYFENIRPDTRLSGNDCENPCLPCSNFEIDCVVKTSGGSRKVTFYGTTSTLSICPGSIGEITNQFTANKKIYALASQKIYVKDCNLDYSAPLNPFTLGILANWYPRTAYKYLGLRNKTNNGTSVTDTRNDGYYSTYNPFWKYNSTQSKWEKENTQSILDKWQFTNSVTIKDQSGNEVENTNPLNINSAALYGFNSNLPIAVATNAKHKELIFDGFEEQKVGDACQQPTYIIGEMTSTPECMLPFRITDGAGAVNTISHTGLYSYRLNSADNHFSTFTHNSPDAPMVNSKEVVNDENSTLTSTLLLSTIPTQVKSKFSPDRGKSYLISFWMHNTKGVVETLSANALVQFQDITYQGFTITFTKLSVDPPIDGWQRVVYLMNIPNMYDVSATHPTQMILQNVSSGGNVVYIDDLRIQPYQSIMKTYVYDDATRRLAAELDENNYATFYEYDEEGALARVKKETSKGIFTVKEIRKNISK